VRKYCVEPTAEFNDFVSIIAPPKRSVKEDINPGPNRNGPSDGSDPSYQELVKEKKNLYSEEVWRCEPAGPDIKGRGEN